MNTEKKPSVLGILGGLGPMSGVYFCEMLTSHTKASKDSDHINFLLSSRADTPDRSSFILGRSPHDPTPSMINEARRLESAGADIIAIPCNTAHYFYESICKSVGIPIINIIDETAEFCLHEGLKKVGVLATEGTVTSGAYSRIFSAKGIEIEPLLQEEQALITKIIFDEIKKGLPPSTDELVSLGYTLAKRGCERLLLGCTELSLIKKSTRLGEYYVDSLELLTLAAISACGKEPIGFDEPLIKYYGNAKKGR